jgi:CRISPR-associated protein Csm1
MKSTPNHITTALETLRFWANRAAGNDAVISPELRDQVRRTAWMLVGEPPPAADAWPDSTPGRLRSVFGRITHATAIEAWFDPASLRLMEEVLFPASADAGTAAAPGIALRDELVAIEGRELVPEAQLEALLFALQRYAWAVPSPLDAVSLYDFARTHAALAAATADGVDELCLVGGDLSGVQDFIYSVPAKGAARQLRGRSLYLQLLTDACAHYLLTQVGMPLCNLLYAGGGRFYALLPGHAAARLDDWRRDIGRHLLAAHHGELYLALGAVSFAPEAYTSDTWKELTQELDADKRRRFATLGDSDFNDLFEPRQPEPPPDDLDEEPLDVMGKSLAELGRDMASATVLVVEPGEPRLLVARERDVTWRDVVRRLGLYTRLHDESPGNVSQGRYRRILQLNDDIPDVAPGSDEIVGMRYTVTEARRATPDDIEAYHRMGLDDDQELLIDHVLPFNYLAACSTGVERIGVLRMDVDDLGDLFGSLERPDGVAALNDTAALSATLSRFFEGWVGQLCREMNRREGEKGGIYAVYSGGDDLFLVGSWHLMPELARRIRDDFARYVLGRRLQPGETPPITLSAGITLHGAGYPLYQAAEDAAEALDSAKGFSRPGGHAKDAISFLGRTFGWEQFAEAEALQVELGRLIAQGAPRGLLMTVQQLAARATGNQHRNRNGAAQFAYGPWIWQGAYQLTRLAERATGDQRQQITDLRERLLGSAAIAQRTIERAGLAARWAQLLARNDDERADNKE